MITFHAVLTQKISEIHAVPCLSTMLLVAGIWGHHHLEVLVSTNAPSSMNTFFCSVRIKLASPRAAQLSMHFPGKSVVMHLGEGPD